MMLHPQTAQTTLLAIGSALALITAPVGDRAHAEDTSTQATQFHLRAFPSAKSRPLRYLVKTNTQFLRARMLVAS
jgi:hypothetical protein